MGARVLISETWYYTNRWRLNDDENNYIGCSYLDGGLVSSFSPGTKFAFYCYPDSDDQDTDGRNQSSAASDNQSAKLWLHEREGHAGFISGPGD